MEHAPVSFMPRSPVSRLPETLPCHLSGSEFGNMHFLRMKEGCIRARIALLRPQVCMLNASKQNGVCLPAGFACLLPVAANSPGLQCMTLTISEICRIYHACSWCSSLSCGWDGGSIQCKRANSLLFANHWWATVGLGCMELVHNLHVN